MKNLLHLLILFPLCVMSVPCVECYANECINDFQVKLADIDKGNTDAEMAMLNLAKKDMVKDVNGAIQALKATRETRVVLLYDSFKSCVNALNP